MDRDEAGPHVDAKQTRSTSGQCGPFWRGGGCSDSRTANYDITQLNICLYAMIQRFSSSSYWYTVHSLTLPFAEQA